MLSVPVLRFSFSIVFKSSVMSCQFTNDVHYNFSFIVFTFTSQCDYVNLIQLLVFNRVKCLEIAADK